MFRPVEGKVWPSQGLIRRETDRPTSHRHESTCNYRLIALGAMEGKQCVLYVQGLPEGVCLPSLCGLYFPCPSHRLDAVPCLPAQPPSECQDKEDGESSKFSVPHWATCPKRQGSRRQPSGDSETGAISQKELAAKIRPQ